MKAKLKHYLLLIAAMSGPVLARAQGTSFNYQGRLVENGVAAGGTYDFIFTAYDAAAGGNALGVVVPVNAVTVNAGNFAVPLDFGVGVFTGPARWLNISVRVSGGGAHTTLSPRQALLPTPYAVLAGSAASVASGTVTAGQLNTAGVAPMPGQFLSYNDGNLVWTSAGVATGNIWSLNGNRAYYNAGNVGIGTRIPANKLTLLTAINNYGLEHTDGNIRLGTYLGGSAGGGWLGTLSNDRLNFFVNDGGAKMTVHTNGYVGIGTTVPAAPLEVNGVIRSTRLGLSSQYVQLDGGDSSSYRLTAQSVFQSEKTLVIQNLSGEARPGVNNAIQFRLGTAAAPSVKMLMDKDGNVGIGSTTPQARLEIVGKNEGGDALRLVGYQPYLTLLDANAGYTSSRIQSAGGEMILGPESYVNRTDGNSYVKLANSGNVSVKSLTIRGGADLAEPFEFSESDIAKGSVLIIDDEQPGKLKLSTRAYDTRVAGIVSGANGVHPGISLRQDGVLGSGEDVALSGRVYVLADAKEGAIKPGDLLTTSDTPGHAMKVTNHPQSQGAILGKAMSELKSGKGMVLVLVTLQ